MKQWAATFLVSIWAVAPVMANDSIASVKHWGAELSVMPGRVISIDKYQSRWMRKQNNWAVDLKFSRQSLPQDSDAYAADYGYPTLSAGLRLNKNHGVTMHKSPSSTWPYLIETDYDSQLGNIATAYFQFSRPLWRTPRWEISYSLATGAGWSRRKYNQQNAIDNEIIGSRWLIFFGAGGNVSYRFSKDWSAKAGLEFYHHSNGATRRPNKGANTVSALLGIAYRPAYEATLEKSKSQPLKPYWYLNFAYALGFRTMLEEWQITQFQTKPDEENYRTGDFKTYRTHHVEASLMYRYARRWASGIGIDAIYADSYRRAEEINLAQGNDEKLSPWSLGISAKHEVFYHRLSVNIAVGAYLFRKMGKMARSLETPYYERIGLSYQIGPVKLGAHVKAHKTKADLTEMTISLPIKL